jgi:hypothetical protein
MISAGIQCNSLVLVMSQGIALSLSLMRNALGNREFPDLTMRGGYVEGIPVIASEAVTQLGSPTANMIAAINAEDVFLADDGNGRHRGQRPGLARDVDAPTQDGTTGGGRLDGLALADRHARPEGHPRDQLDAGQRRPCSTSRRRLRPVVRRRPHRGVTPVRRERRPHAPAPVFRHIRGSHENHRQGRLFRRSCGRATATNCPSRTPRC